VKISEAESNTEIAFDLAEVFLFAIKPLHYAGSDRTNY
jgi:hypothetical protein